MALSFRIEGATDAAGKVQQFNRETLEVIREKARERAAQTVFRFQTEMDREYTSAWATGMLARGITYKTFVKGDGVEVRFYIKHRRELRYVTTALGGHFKQFPVGPFEIRPVRAKSLLIPFPNSLARQFIRGEGGRFQGSKGGSEGEPAPGIRVKQVLWGKRTGGFSRDVISEVMASESALFVRDMTAAVEGIAVKVTS
jgi:hypothetical protein